MHKSWGGGGGKEKQGEKGRGEKKGEKGEAEGSESSQREKEIKMETGQFHTSTQWYASTECWLRVWRKILGNHMYIQYFSENRT